MASTKSYADIVANLRSIDASSFTSDIERRQALREARALISRLETPWETSERLNVNYPTILACIHTAMDLKLFHSWLSKNDGKPSTAKELKALVPQCDDSLFMRIIRHLASSDFLWLDSPESGEVLYRMTPYIRGQVEDDVGSQLECTFLWAMPMTMSLPKFFEKSNYTNPQKASIDIVKEYTGGLSIWEYLQKEGWTDLFGRLMRASTKERGDVVGLIEDQQLDSLDKDSVLLVDIGGSRGHDLIAFRQNFKDAQGRLILQDLPHVIEKVPTLDEWGIEKMSYDFFTPQPMVGAKAYLLRNILHDWPDDEAKRILEMVAKAMDSKESKLLIVDKVIREEDPLANETGMDWMMMIYGNGMEREYTQC